MDVAWPDPAPDLTTPRLRLRPLRLDDAPAIQRIFADAEATRHVSFAPMEDLAPAVAAVEGVLQRYNRREAIRWAITLPDDDTAVGTVGFLNISFAHRRAEIGYDLAHHLWGQSLVPEAASAVIAFGFGPMHLHRIEADILPANNGSARVLEKLGFHPEAHLADYLVIKGRPRTVHRYRLLAPERPAPEGTPQPAGHDSSSKS
jgi:ribosomal-protein-alanine N-acetyltransferase